MNILPIAEYTIKENIRSKILYILLLFGFIMIGSSLVFSSLAPYTEARVITDIGLACIELFTLMAGIFAAVNLVLQEIENRTIYLLMTRPLRRWEYIVGRYLGVLVILCFNIMIMLGILILLLKLTTNWILGPMFIWSAVAVFFKLIIIVAVALTASLVFTSSITAMAFSFLTWIIGHFSSELKLMAEKVQSFLAKGLLYLLYYAVPNFQLFNLKDKLGIPEGMPLDIVSMVLLYGIIYAAICLVVASLFFAKKEF
ncbi:MAG: ABC transporter permease subunit [bacterium]|nr:ABC transporter permease subunit [bacterium]